MKTDFHIGASIDVVTSDELTSAVDDIETRLRRKPQPKPLIPSPRTGSFSTADSATVPFIIRLGSPPIGSVWDILGITVAGTDDSTTVSGKVALYIGDHANVSLISLRVPALVIPSYTTIGKDRIFCQPSEYMFANVTGVANNQQIVVIVQVAEWKQNEKLRSAGY